VTDRAARRRAELRLVTDWERVDPGQLLDPRDAPEPDPGPWRGPTDRGRRLMRLAREQLRGAPRWSPEPDE